MKSLQINQDPIGPQSYRLTERSGEDTYIYDKKETLSSTYVEFFDVGTGYSFRIDSTEYASFGSSQLYLNENRLNVAIESVNSSPYTNGSTIEVDPQNWEITLKKPSDNPNFQESYPEIFTVCKCNNGVFSVDLDYAKSLVKSNEANFIEPYFIFTYDSANFVSKDYIHLYDPEEHKYFELMDIQFQNVNMADINYGGTTHVIRFNFNLSLQ